MEQLPSAATPVAPSPHRLRVQAWLNTPRGGLALLIVTTFLAHLLFASSLGLGMDESYMVAAGRTIQLGYFDHPPVSWWLAWAATQIAGTDTGLAVRFPFLMLSALSTWLMFRLASDLFDECAGLWAAVLFNAVPVLGITAGTWVLPDGPLIAAMLGASVCLVRALQLRNGSRNELPGRASWGWWLGTGACFGLALCSKYTAVLTGAGVALFLLTQPQARRWLARPQPYAGALLAFAMFSPVLLWNAGHGWASLAFQGGRADGGRWHPFGPLSTLAGEALFFLPWIWLGAAYCIWRALRNGPAEWRGWLLACMVLPPVLAFEVVSLRSHVLFHWAAPGAMLSLPLLGDLIGRYRRNSFALRAGMVATAVTLVAGVGLVGSEVRYNWLPMVFEHFALGSDPDLDAVDWTSLRLAFEDRADLRQGAAVAAIRWHDAGKVDYALRGLAPVICLGDDPRQYGLSAPVSHYNGRDIVLLAPRETLASLTAKLAGTFDMIEPLPPVMIMHAGRPAMLLPVFLGRNLHVAGAAS